MRIALLLTALIFCSCSHSKLSVETTFFGRKDLASTIVGTPDPSKQLPIFGQRLNISWNAPGDPSLSLQIEVRLKKGDKLTKTVPLETSSGTYIFPIVGENYTQKGGILSYKVALLSNGAPLAESKHKFWVEDIHFSE